MVTKLFSLLRTGALKIKSAGKVAFRLDNTGFPHVIYTIRECVNCNELRPDLKIAQMLNRRQLCLSGL